MTNATLGAPADTRARRHDSARTALRVLPEPHRHDRALAEHSGATSRQEMGASPAPSSSHDLLVALLEDSGLGASRRIDTSRESSPSEPVVAQGLHALTFLALMELERGQLRVAQVIASEGLDIARQRRWTESSQVVLIHLVLALIHVERNELTQAERLLGRCQNAQDGGQLSPIQTATQVAHARLLLAAGNAERAKAVLAEVARMPTDQELPRFVRQWRDLAEAELDLVTGRPYAAFERARQVPSGDDGSSDLLRVIAARAQLAFGCPAEAESILAPVRDTVRNTVARVETWLITALAADHMRKDNQAIEALGHALQAAGPECIRRPFHTMDPARIAVMLRHRQGLTNDRSDFAEELLAQLDAPDPALEVTTSLTNPLTDREQIVLRHLVTQQTNEDIATVLCISVNTVKAHAKSVYRKLAVSNRREAATTARGLGLL